MGANVEKKKNILGETSVMLTGYEKSGTVEPYYAEKGDPLFTWLQGLVDEQKVLDDCATKMVEVHLWEEATEGAYPAIQDDVVVEVSSYGGDNTGYQLPFNVHYLGKPVKGTLTRPQRSSRRAAVLPPDFAQIKARWRLQAGFV